MKNLYFKSLIYHLQILSRYYQINQKIKTKRVLLLSKINLHQPNKKNYVKNRQGKNRRLSRNIKNVR